MVLWSDIDRSAITTVASGKERQRFVYKGGPLRFQIPRGFCSWGVGSYKSFTLDLSSPEFLVWWRDIEAALCAHKPFNSNLKGASLRLKIDDSTFVFDEHSKQVNPEICEGLFRGQELSCLVDIESTYFFNGNWGLTCKAAQVRFYPVEELPAEPAESSAGATSLPKGVCSFLETD